MKQILISHKDNASKYKLQFLMITSFIKRKNELLQTLDCSY